ncbi:hypothetical protein AMAG_05232 [Allomyces macrogynus ATCC 38327]|uniref:Uncharacterized protein n=1 Tax=Allomyces macrogynus (strain ATCC 38327) TaxID=578462 RepID=A0A0L0SBI2_ALLM3|nr:hypothetical protein AMAG_05232 [Allomyces macrogynus ATCC 38327]|eukprot:KNE59769.1 hypothetical protein AMAG_05232 [Allomyces macrogynus ATCC 38327]
MRLDTTPGTPASGNQLAVVLAPRTLPKPDNDSAGLPEVRIVPEHYVPLDQLALLKPAEQVAHLAGSPIVSHRVYLGRMLGDLLPGIRRAATLLDALPSLFKLVTDPDDGVRLACASSLAKLVAGYQETNDHLSLADQLAAGTLATPSVSAPGATALPEWTPETCLAMIRALDPTATAIVPGGIPACVANVVLLPLLMDPQDRVAHLAKDQLLDALHQHPRAAAPILFWAARLAHLSPGMALALLRWRAPAPASENGEVETGSDAAAAAAAAATTTIPTIDPILASTQYVLTQSGPHDMYASAWGRATPAMTETPRQRLDHVHLAALNLLADPLVHGACAAHDRATLAALLPAHRTSANHHIRAACAAACAAAAAVSATVLATTVLPTLVSLAGDRLYIVRRRVAEAVPPLLEKMPTRQRRSLGRELVDQLLADASKAVRDAMYAGLARVLIALAAGEPEGVVDDWGYPDGLAMVVEGGSGSEKRVSESGSTVSVTAPPVGAASGGETEPESDSDRARDSVVIDDADIELDESASAPPAVTHPLLAYPPTPTLPPRALFPAHVPAHLLQTFCLHKLRWKDPDRVAKCAYTFPALAATMPRAWWRAWFRPLFTQLAADAAVRAPLVAAVPVESQVIPPSAVADDLLPALAGWMALTHVPAVLARTPAPTSPEATRAAETLIRVPLDRASDAAWGTREAIAKAIPSYLALYALPHVQDRWGHVVFRDTPTTAAAPGAVLTPPASPTPATDAVPTEAAAELAHDTDNLDDTPSSSPPLPTPPAEPAERDPSHAALRAWTVLAPVLATLLGDRAHAVRTAAANSAAVIATHFPCARTDILARVAVLADGEGHAPAAAARVLAGLVDLGDDVDTVEVAVGKLARSGVVGVRLAAADAVANLERRHGAFLSGAREVLEGDAVPAVRERVMARTVEEGMEE